MELEKELKLDLELDLDSELKIKLKTFRSILFNIMNANILIYSLTT